MQAEIEKENIKLMILPVDDGAASVCAEIGDALYEDPDHADVPEAEAVQAVAEYRKAGLDVIEIAGNWDSLE